MRISVVADFVALVIFAAKKLRPPVGIPADDEESCLYIFLFQNVQNLGRPGWVRSVIESDGQFFLGRANLLDVVGKRVRVVGFAGNQIALRIVGETPMAALRSVVEVPDIAIPFEDQ